MSLNSFILKFVEHCQWYSSFIIRIKITLGVNRIFLDIHKFVTLDWLIKFIIGHLVNSEHCKIRMSEYFECEKQGIHIFQPTAPPYKETECNFLAVPFSIFTIYGRRFTEKSSEIYQTNNLVPSGTQCELIRIEWSF